MIYAQHKYDMTLSKHTFNTYERLKTCQAHYVDVGNTVILKSYDSIVAIFNKRVGTFYVFNYYRATTVQHINKFADMLNWDRTTYLYKRSDRVLELRRNFLGWCIDHYKPSKEEWKKFT